MLKLISFSALAALAFFPLSAGAASSCGIASWYGPGFHGNRTASGERFNSRALTAAHKSLPFGTRVKVTNQENGHYVTIKINDNGPHVPGRIIDLSEGAFARIASPSQGIAKVCFTAV